MIKLIKKLFININLKMYECRDIYHHNARITLANGEEFYFGKAYCYTRYEFDKWADRMMAVKTTIKTDDEQLVHTKYVASIECVKTDAIRDFHYIDPDRFGMDYFQDVFIMEQTGKHNELKNKLEILTK